MLKQYAVIGLGRFGKNLAKTLSELGNQVMAVDVDEEAVSSVSDYVTHGVIADITVEGTLKDIGVQNFDVCIISMSANFEAALMATTEAKELGVKIVIAKAKDDLHGRILKKVGADRIVIPERDMGIRMAHTLASSNVLDFIEISNEFSMLEISAPKSWIGKSMKAIEVRGKYGINIVAIKHDNEFNINPGADYVINSGDILLVIGRDVDIDKLAVRTDE